MITIRDATEAEVRAFVGFMPLGLRNIFTAFDGERQLGVCGVLRDPAYYGTILEEDGRWIAFLDLVEDLPKSFGLRAVMTMARYLRRNASELWVYCDNIKYPDAPRLLNVLGFEPTDEIRPNWRNPTEKVRLWIWQA